MAWRKIGQSERYVSGIQMARPRSLYARRRLARTREIQPRTPRIRQRGDSFWKRLGLALLFVMMASTGLASYAGYGRMVGAQGGQTPARIRRAARSSNVAVMGGHDSDKTSPWLDQARSMASVAAIMTLGDVATALTERLARRATGGWSVP